MRNVQYLQPSVSSEPHAAGIIGTLCRCPPEIGAHQVVPQQFTSNPKWRCRPHDLPGSPGSSTMETKSQRLKGPDGTISSLNAAIDTLDLARGTSNVKPAKDAIGSTSVLLTTIRVRLLPAHVSPCCPIPDRPTQDSTIEEVDCVGLGLICAQVCQVLDQRIAARRQEQPNRLVLEAIERLEA